MSKGNKKGIPALKGWMDVPTAAKIWKVSAAYVNILCHRGRIECARIGNQIIIKAGTKYPLPQGAAVDAAIRRKVRRDAAMRRAAA